MLRTRLFLGLLPLLLILICTGAYSIQRSRELAGSLSRSLTTSYRATFTLQQMREALAEMNLALSASRQGNTADDRAQAHAKFNEQHGAFSRELMDQSSVSTEPGRAAFVSQLADAFQKFSVRADGALRNGGSLFLADAKEDAAAYYGVLDAIERLVRYDATSARETAARVELLAAHTERVLYAAIGAAVVVSIFLAGWLASSLLTPIKALTASAVALGEGHLDREVPVLSRDELGLLAIAFNNMAGKLRSYREATLARVLRTQRTMEATLTSAPDPVFVVDREGAHAVRNPAAEQLAQTSDYSGPVPPALAPDLQRVLTTGEHYLPTEYSHAITLRVGREERHYLPRILAIGDKLTEFKGAAVILQDVTKFRLLDDAKTNLVGTVSHELKTPLTSLRMAIYLLLEQKLEGLTPTQRELLEDARNDSDRLLRILDNLLDLARLEAGTASLDRHEVAVSELVDTAAGEARGLIEPAGKKLVVHVSPVLAQAKLDVDAPRLRHVFMNLLTNAAKYSPPGGTITLTASAEPGSVRFAVRDEGPGIAPESVPHVFERFYRAPDQTKTGAGLGLAIAREIVVAHGGSIGVQSTIGHGAEFHFQLPT